MAEPQSYSSLRAALRRWPDNVAKAFFRTQEALLFQDVDLAAPCLDLGCGGGDFATLIPQRIEVGVDRDETRIHRAAGAGVYGACVRADLRKLPFADGTFGSALANSVLEHVRDVERTVREVHRVLRRGADFWFTVPGPRKREWMLTAQTADRDGRPDLAVAYRAEFDASWAHLHYIDKAGWSEMLLDVGFSQVELAEYEPRGVSDLIDVLNNLQVRTRVTGSPELDALRAEVTAEYLARSLHRQLAEGPVTEGANVFGRATR